MYDLVAVLALKEVTEQAVAARSKKQQARKSPGLLARLKTSIQQKDAGANVSDVPVFSKKLAEGTTSEC